MKSSLKTISGLTVGVVIGYAVALLTAPQSGEETREAIKEEFQDKKGIAKDRLVEMKDQAAKKFQDKLPSESGFESEAQNIVEEFSGRIRELAQKYEK